MACPDWMIEKTQVQAQKFADDIAASNPGNAAQLEQRWLGYLDSYADQCGCTVDELVKQAGLPAESPHLPPPG